MTKGRSTEPQSLARGRAAHGERTGSAAGGPGPGKVLGAYCLLFVQKRLSLQTLAFSLTLTDKHTPQSFTWKLEPHRRK